MSASTAWSHGYPVSQTYPPSWHSFQSPAHLRLVCALMGVAWEVDAHTPLSIAEVGCGSGYTAQVLAAGNPQAQVLGLDYNPAHIAEARSLSAAASLPNARFLEADLADMGDAEIDRLPEFDLITVHGVWSWVADEVRQGLLRLIGRRLKPGGLALVTYNALPGAATTLGLSRLVRAGLAAHGGGEAALEVVSQQVKQLVAAEAMHLPPTLWRQMVTGEAGGVRPGYLLHEFSTDHWRPSFHADVAAAMGAVRCDYAGSASLDENFPHLSLSPEQIALWEAAPDIAARELIFDVCVKRPFRRDLYVRGLRRVPRDAAVDALWLALNDASPGDKVLNTQLGEARLPPPVMEATLSALARGPQTIGALRALPACANVTAPELLALLVGSRCAVPLWQPLTSEASSPAGAAARRLNRAAADRFAPHGRGLGQYALATPSLGGGLPATALDLAVARRLMDWPVGDAAPPVTAATVAMQILPPGAPPEAEVIRGLHSAVDDLLTHRWPIWRALGVLS